MRFYNFISSMTISLVLLALIGITSAIGSSLWPDTFFRPYLSGYYCCCSSSIWLYAQLEPKNPRVVYSGYDGQELLGVGAAPFGYLG